MTTTELLIDPAPRTDEPTVAPTGPTEPTVDELIDAADEADTGGPGLSARLADIRQTAADGGVSVTVDLHGKLVGLTIGHEALRLRAAGLAALIVRLTGEATTAALAAGMSELAGVCDESLLRSLTGLGPDGTRP